VQPGVAFIDATVDHTGKVTDVTVTRAPDAATGKAWADAVRQWTFQPGTFKGKPADVVYTVTVGMDK
jgi:TonB family protein